jgi:hypothetical protein
MRAFHHAALLVLTWCGHDPAHPTADTWMALQPASLAATIDGPTLQCYTVHHARHMSCGLGCYDDERFGEPRALNFMNVRSRLAACSVRFNTQPYQPM